MRTSFTYDNRNRLEYHIFPDGKQYEYTYDNLTNVTEIKTPNGDIINQQYDDLNRLAQKTFSSAEGACTYTYTYDENSNPDTFTAATPNDTFVTRYTHNPRNLPSKVDYDYPNIGHKTLYYTYDDAGNRSSMTVGGRTTTYKYNDRGQSTYIGWNRIRTQSGTTPTVTGAWTAVTYDSGTDTTTLEHAGQTWTSGDYEGAVLCPDDTLPTQTFTIISNTADTLTVDGDLTAFITTGKSYELYSANLLEVVEEGTWSSDPSYDGSTATTFTDTSKSWTDDEFSTGHFLLPKPGAPQLAVTGNTASSLSADGNYASVAAAGDQYTLFSAIGGAGSSHLAFASFSYDDDGRQHKKIFGDGTTKSYAYDKYSRLAAVKTETWNNTNLMTHEYGYSDSGNKLYEKHIYANFEKADFFKYDNLYRVIGTKYGINTGADLGTSVSNYSATVVTVAPVASSTLYDDTDDYSGQSLTQGLDFDLLHNRKTFTQAGSVAETINYNGSTYSPDPRNWITSIDDGGSPVSPAWNDNGCLVDDGTLLYQWTPENRLEKITGGAEDVTFAYDEQGRRVAKTVGSETVYYIYDGWSVVEEITCTAASDNVTAQYLNGRDLDEPIAAWIDGVNSGEPIYFHQNPLGNVEFITDVAGNVIERYSYDIHGNVTVLNPDGTVNSTDPDDAKSPYLFTARRWEKGLKLYYFRNRYYSPALGRFISPDPLDYVDGMNVYAYVNGNTVNLVDPMGLAITEEDLIVKDGIAYWAPATMHTRRVQVPNPYHENGEPVWSEEYYYTQNDQIGWRNGGSWTPIAEHLIDDIFFIPDLGLLHRSQLLHVMKRHSDGYGFNNMDKWGHNENDKKYIQNIFRLYAQGKLEYDPSLGDPGDIALSKGIVRTSAALRLGGQVVLTIACAPATAVKTAGAYTLRFIGVSLLADDLLSEARTIATGEEQLSFALQTVLQTGETSGPHGQAMAASLLFLLDPDSLINNPKNAKKVIRSLETLEEFKDVRRQLLAFENSDELKKLFREYNFTPEQKNKLKRIFKELNAPKRGALVKGPDFRNITMAQDHYAKHARGVVFKRKKGKIIKVIPKKGGADLPEIKNFKDYQTKARQMWNRDAGLRLHEYRTKSGDVLRYDLDANTFGVLSKDGYIRTYFRPDDGYQYFLNQVGN